MKKVFTKVFKLVLKYLSFSFAFRHKSIKIEKKSKISTLNVSNHNESED